MTASSAPVVVAAEPDALAPVREALLTLARRDAQRMIEEADADAAATQAEAARQVEEIRSAARAEAATDSAALLAVERARTNRESRAVELRARRAADDELVRPAREAGRVMTILLQVLVGELSDDPGLQDRLAALARGELGPTATVHRNPDGGVTAQAGGRRVSYPLSALADQAVAELLSSRDES